LTEPPDGSFACFSNHPDEGLFFLGWPDALALSAWPRLGRLVGDERSAAVQLLQSYRPGLLGAVPMGLLGAGQAGGCLYGPY